MAGDVETALRDFGGAVTDLFGSTGATATASSYEQAAAIAAQNAQIAKQSTAIKETQISRQLFKVIGKQTSGVGGAGFASSGTALDLMRSSASEGAMAKALAAEQGAITENTYAEQAGLYSNLAKSAKSSGTGQVIGGIIQGAGGAVSAYNAAKGLFNAAPVAADIGTVGSSTAITGATASDTLLTGMDIAGDAGAAAIAGVGADAVMGAGAIEAGTAAEVGFLGEAAAGTVAADAAIGVGAAEAAGGLELADVAAVALWVICTELRHQKKLSDSDYRQSAPRFIELPQDVQAGYHWWALPYVRLMRHAKYGGFFTALVRPIAQARVDYLNGRFNVVGWLTVVVGHPLCSLIGKFVNPRGFCGANS